jgi:hypothetical protein
MGEPEPPRPKLGDYGLATHRGRLTHTFQPANPVAFDIKTSVQNGLKEKWFDETDIMSPHEHLSHFAETCEFCVPPANCPITQFTSFFIKFVQEHNLPTIMHFNMLIHILTYNYHTNHVLKHNNNNHARIYNI